MTATARAERAAARAARDDYRFPAAAAAVQPATGSTEPAA
jgi:hypothetical protein